MWRTRCVTGRERGIEKQSGLVNRPRVSIGIRGGGGVQDCSGRGRVCQRTRCCENGVSVSWRQSCVGDAELETVVAAVELRAKGSGYPIGG